MYPCEHRVSRIDNFSCIAVGYCPPQCYRVVLYGAYVWVVFRGVFQNDRKNSCKGPDDNPEKEQEVSDVHEDTSQHQDKEAELIEDTNKEAKFDEDCNHNEALEDFDVI